MSASFTINSLRKTSLATSLFTVAVLGVFGCASSGTADSASSGTPSAQTSASSAGNSDWDDDPGRFEWTFTVAPDSEAESDKKADDKTHQADANSGLVSEKSAAKKPKRIYYSAEDDDDGDRGFVLHRSDEESDFDD